MRHERENENLKFRDMRLAGVIKDAAQTVLLTLEDPVLNSLFVAGVSGGGGKSYTICIEPRDEAVGVPETLLLEKLKKISGLVRDEVASDISRKRVPTIGWAVAPRWRER